jgi:hypothetical protein
VQSITTSLARNPPRVHGYMFCQVGSGGVGRQDRNGAVCFNATSALASLAANLNMGASPEVRVTAQRATSLINHDARRTALGCTN